MDGFYKEHVFPPIINRDSKILILGSFPSVISRREGFYYMNPQNRFWKVLGTVLNENFSCSIENKKILLKKHKIALFDVVKSCEIKGSQDSELVLKEYNDILSLAENSDINAIFLNGTKAFNLFDKKFSDIKIKYFKMPSTSSANAKFNFEKLISEWIKILKFLQNSVINLS